MIRGEMYRVYKGSSQDPKNYRVFVVVSRQVVIDSKFSTVVCAPIYTRQDGLSTQVQLGIADGLKHDCSIHCDELMSVPKSALTHFVATLSPQKMRELNKALAIALALDL